MEENVTIEEMEKAKEAFYLGDIGNDNETGFKLLDKDEETINLIGKVLFNLTAQLGGMEMEFLTGEDIESLNRTSQFSFYHEQKERFEIVKGSEQDAAKDGEGTMMWYATQLEGLIAFNYYATKYKTVLLWDMAENPEPQHCLIVDKKIEV